MSVLPRYFMPGAKTERRREVIRRASKARRELPDLDVVRFYIPEPPPLVPWETGEASAKVSVPVCEVSKERGYINVNPGFRLRVVARVFDARDKDTFWLDERGEVWEEDTRDDETYWKDERKWRDE